MYQTTIAIPPNTAYPYIHLVYPSTHPSNHHSHPTQHYLSVHLVHPSTHPSNHRSHPTQHCLSICLSVHPATHPSVHSPVSFFLPLLIFVKQHSADDHEPTYTHYDDDDDDFIDDTFTSNYSGAANRFGRPFPIVCKALYEFEVRVGCPLGYVQ